MNIETVLALRCYGCADEFGKSSVYTWPKDPPKCSYAFGYGKEFDCPGKCEKLVLRGKGICFKGIQFHFSNYLTSSIY